MGKDINELHSKTKKYIDETSINKRKTYGQYFTIKSIRNRLISNLPKELLNKKNLKILDPGCGTGEFLLSCEELFNEPILEGWDIDEEVLNIAREIVPKADLKLINTLEYTTNNKYDLIIGNPPYYEFKPSERVKEYYKQIINGRINIYSLFIFKSILLLKEGGILAFVNPPSMNNGSYFSKLRKFIIENMNIEYLEILDAPSYFEGANQSVMLIILKKGINNGNYVFKKGKHILFSNEVLDIESRFKNKTTLKELGFIVKTGKIVWNQNKEKLTDEQTYPPLIWSHNIENNKIILNNNKKKKQFINNKLYNTGPAIVVNRIVGQPGKGKLKAAMIPEGMDFLAENHVNVIFKNNSLFNNNVTLEMIFGQLIQPDRLSIIKKITGNTQISKTELEELFPIDKL